MTWRFDVRHLLRRSTPNTIMTHKLTSVSIVHRRLSRHSFLPRTTNFLVIVQVNAKSSFALSNFDERYCCYATRRERRAQEMLNCNVFFLCAMRERKIPKTCLAVARRNHSSLSCVDMPLRMGRPLLFSLFSGFFCFSFFVLFPFCLIGHCICISALFASSDYCLLDVLN